ncbi:restriction endonuclease fold toxin-2 domain-containing protein [Streptacidiphilus fuscans]|uniref:restriction endonuclease fold toxin-2 domain-containing protein n=1 Tax=Streptacidiphilus fuscans TaxID=2789292 RepID=UPI002E2C13C4|nr:restriction endonuclease fold toxin-2 domain-containing protein [Streptacidiphilus fuscans]
MVGDLVNASWGMQDISETLLSAVNSAVGELSEQQGMVGADDAGSVFASVYTPAATTTINQIANSCYITGQGASSILTTANNYLAAESQTAAELLAATGGDGSQLAQPWSYADQCAQDPRGIGATLADARGGTSFVDQYLLGERFRGDSGKLRTVADTWRKVATVTAGTLSDAQLSWSTATAEFTGTTADGVNTYFQRFVGKDPYPPRPYEGATLMANLPAACQALAAACEAYADHIDAAAKVPPPNPLLDPEPFWDNPALGGNGQDGGLHDAVVADPDIHALAALAHILDGSQSVVPVPTPEPGPPGPGPLPPLPGPVPEPLPVLIPAVYRPVPPGSNIVPPIGPPIPPDPRFPALSPSQRLTFDGWVSGLRTGDYSGGNAAEQAYQLRTSGYPEYEVPIPAGLSKSNTLMVDGLRSTDGMAVEAKYVKNQNSCYRTLDELIKNHATGKKNFLFLDDRLELKKYAAAIADPRNQGQIRGVEIDTNNQPSIAYWRTMMAAYGVKGYARYVP